MNELRNLLKNTNNLLEQNEELTLLKGESFNIFQIFNMESDENKMHSQFINTLIDPKGKHGRGTIYLKLFLESIGMPSYFDSLDNVFTKVEYSIGKVIINGMRSSGGRIDIYISNNHKSISIENKIYAVDQEKQIVRYYNYNKENNIVYYLNLFGTEPSGNFSKGELKSNLENEQKTDFYCISYSETIQDWLEKCQKESADFPIIRETIKQYIISIKRLTGQLINHKMKKEINKLIIENLESARTIAANIDSAVINIVNPFISALVEEVSKELGNNWCIEKINIKKKWSTIKISHNEWIKNTSIALQGQSLIYENKTIIGLLTGKEPEVWKQLETSIIEGELDQIKIDYPGKSNIWYFYGTIFNLGDKEQFEKLLSNESREQFVLSVSKEIIDLARLLEKHLKITC